MLIREIYNVMEVHPLEKERLKKLAMAKRGQDAGIPSHIPADAIKKSLKRPMYTKEYLSKIFAHPDTTVKDLKQIETSLYNRVPLNVVSNPEVDEMIDMVRAEIKRRGREAILKVHKRIVPDSYSMDIDDYSYRDQVGGQKASSRPDLEHPLATDMPDRMGIDIGSLFQQGQSPDEIADQLADEYGIGKSRAVKMVNQWQDRGPWNKSSLHSNPMSFKVAQKFPKYLDMSKPFHKLLKSFIDDGYDDKDIIDLVATDPKIKDKVNMNMLPKKLKVIRDRDMLPKKLKAIRDRGK
jgi:hypothetical protein